MGTLLNFPSNYVREFLDFTRKHYGEKSRILNELLTRSESLPYSKKNNCKCKKFCFIITSKLVVWRWESNTIKAYSLDCSYQNKLF